MNDMFEGVTSTGVNEKFFVSNFHTKYWCVIVLFYFAN